MSRSGKEITPGSNFYLSGGTTEAIGDKTTTINHNNSLGINATTPATTMHVNSNLPATDAINADATVLRLSRPFASGVKFDNVAQFNLGSYAVESTNLSAKTRLDLALNDGADAIPSTNVMTWQANGFVGVNNTGPSNKLIVDGINAAAVTLGTEPSNAIFRVDGASNHALDMGTFAANPYGAYIQSHNKASASTLPLSLNPSGGNLGIGTLDPKSKLEVNGSFTNASAFNSGVATAILFGNSNLTYTTASPGAFNLQGMKDGGTYTLAVQGTTTSTSSFLGLNPAGTSFTFLSSNNGQTVAGKHTIYTFIVMGTTVYYFMETGF